ncbi:putative bacteriophage regulatory protein [Thermodesulfovibrio sp. N1]|uniref:phage late control D family protein n=1 Tax=unclassified Thermodesulfovibrio TaxID=2645936 RepID=UPI00083AFC87|nr:MULTISPECIES: contractile injection system protein, VgrG/Pvc8 family [unclassified Thermodesulfovibrio]MDI1471934.1 contractile injection system protein, VgrG/Pvc8 family [Thermodesulfovibrio sp. 1176]ODA44237.1 putative bacteriophage regulatory protein [Thermodesulfovibrio sp. N1]
MEKVRKPLFFIEYEKKDITAYITPYALSVTYTDYVHGKSDEIEIQLEDREHLWKSSWYPQKGDLITLKIGYEGEKLLPCGSFEIDEIELSAPPDVVSLKGLATNIKKALRQANTKAYENKTLKQIAEEIAKKHGYELVGEIKDIKIKRITQKQERDIAFLKRLAEDYGYVFKITDGKLVFYEIEALESQSVVYIIDRKDMISFSFRDKTYELYKACEVQYHDPKTKKVITHTVNADGVTKGDTLKINERVENKEQAIAKAKAHLKAKNKMQTEGNIVIIGNPKLVAGSNIEITGLYILNGKYHIESAKHTISRMDGYKTELEVRRVA